MTFKFKVGDVLIRNSKEPGEWHNGMKEGTKVTVKKISCNDTWGDVYTFEELNQNCIHVEETFDLYSVKITNWKKRISKKSGSD